MLNGISRLFYVIDEVIIKNNKGAEQDRGGVYYKNILPYNGIINIEWTFDQVNKFLKALYFPPHKGALLKFNDNEYIINTMEDYVNIVYGRDC